MGGLERDIELLEEYKQWQAVNRSRPDTSPTAFMVEKAQQEAFSKLEKLKTWFEDECEDLSRASRESFQWIMDGGR